MLGRRQALHSDAYVVTSRIQAGTVQRLELAAPIRRTDGTTLGYVGASVSLEATRQRLRRLAARGLRVRVVDAGGAIDTTQLNQPVVAFIFDGKGLMYNLSLEGSKISRIHKD